MVNEDVYSVAVPVI